MAKIVGIILKVSLSEDDKINPTILLVLFHFLCVAKSFPKGMHSQNITIFAAFAPLKKEK